MKTNDIPNEFSHNIRNVKVLIEKNTQKRFLFSKDGKTRIYLERVPFKELLKEQYGVLVLGLVGIALVELFAYGYFYFILIAVALEFYIYKKKDTECIGNVKKIYTLFRYFIFAEIAIYLTLLFINVKNILLSAPIASSLFLINFYVFMRIYLFMLQVKFRTLYKMKDYDGFYVWSEKC